MSEKVPFSYYNAVTEFASGLQNLKLLKKEKQFLKKSGETNSLPSRDQYRERLRKITREISHMEYSRNMEQKNFDNMGDTK